MQKRIRAEAPDAVNRRFGSFPALKFSQARLGIKNLLAPLRIEDEPHTRTNTSSRS